MMKERDALHFLGSVCSTDSLVPFPHRASESIFCAPQPVVVVVVADADAAVGAVVYLFRQRLLSFTRVRSLRLRQQTIEPISSTTNDTRDVM
jgi:hypothetical protein